MESFSGFYLGFVLASLAFECVVSQISDGNQSAEIADVHAIRIGYLEQALTQELGSTVRYLTITLHLTETKSTVAGSALHGLSHENLNGTASSRMDFVVHHVLETLIICWSQKHLRIDFTTGVTIVHDFVATQMVTVFLEEGGDFLHVDGIVEWCGVTDFTLV